MLIHAAKFGIFIQMGLCDIRITVGYTNKLIRIFAPKK
jgi:hypothetical protein